jgi:D-galactarolactone cycloisomerase
MSKFINIQQIETFVLRYPLTRPVQTSFGLMFDRPMVLVRVTNNDGQQGWGEIWCNFPSVGAEHRKRLADEILAPLIIGKQFDKPQDLYDYLTRSVEILTIQCAEPGPFAQAIAGIDLAVWDLAARLNEKPLWQFMGGINPLVKVYASGLNPTNPERLAAEKYKQGFRAFKLKIGFGEQTDGDNLDNLRNTLGDDVDLMVDANQSWNLTEAKRRVKFLEAFNLRWLEEPMKVTTPPEAWKELADSTNIPLAGGENIMGKEQFEQVIEAGSLKVIQPDIAKWGGFSDCLPVAHSIRQSSALYCPHYLGGGIGLLCSAHLLAAVGGDGMLEIDANENPLRQEMCGPLNNIDNGTSLLSDEPGIGFVPNLNSGLKKYLV